MASESIITGLPEPQGFEQDPLYYYARVYLSFLQGLFKQFPEGSYRWSEDESLSEITITDQAPIPKDRIEQKPAIVTMRGPAQFGNLSLDNLESLDVKSGKRRHSDLVSCTMTLNIIAKLGAESQRLGWIVFTNLRRFNRLLQRQAHLHQVGNQMSISNESPPGAFVTPEVDSEFVMVTVQSPFFFKWTEEISPLDAPIADKITAHLTGTLMTPQTTGIRQETVLRRPTIRGVPIYGTPVSLGGFVKQTVKP